MHSLWSQTITALDDDDKANSITSGKQATRVSATIKMFQVLLLAKQEFGAAVQVN